MHKLWLRLCLAGSLMLGIISGSAVDGAAAGIPLRGIVEGFYGQPWTQAIRLDMLQFCTASGLNAYIYAPKDDPYHRTKWRQPYPAADCARLQELVRAAQAGGVHFIFAVSPGLDISYEGEAADRDRELLLAKLDSMYALGVRDFAIFFDDIPAEAKDGKGAAQAQLVNRMEEQMRARHPGEQLMFFTVPTEYYRQDMEQDGQPKAYTRAFARHLAADVVVLYTGEGVALGNLTAEQLQAADNLYSRQLGLWWNYPVNDYATTARALGPVEKMPAEPSLPAVFYNPMEQPQLSKLALATGAACAADPAAYEPEKAWREALKQQYGPLATAMGDVAQHMQHLQNSWARIGRDDAPEMKAELDEYLQLWRQQDSKKPESRQLLGRRLSDELQQLTTDCTALETGLPAETKAELLPQLQQLRRLARAASLAIVMSEQDSAAVRVAFAQAYSEVKAHDAEAEVSKLVLRAFVDESAIMMKR